MLSVDVTTRKPGSGSDWLSCKFIRPTRIIWVILLPNFARSLKVAEENRELNATRVKAVSGVCSTFGFQNLNAQQEKAVAEFLSGSDVFVNLPTGYGKPLIYHMAPLVSGDWTFKAAQPFSKRKHSRMQNLTEKKSETLQQLTRKKLPFYFRYVRLAHYKIH